jgi:uncharacterized membrane protein
MQILFLGGHGLIGAASPAGGGQRLPARCHILFRLWFLCGIPAFAAVLAILWLMLAKPVI